MFSVGITMAERDDTRDASGMLEIKVYMDPKLME